MRRPSPPVWHGTHAEATDLLNAALHHCTCVVDDRGVRGAMCPPHTMVFTDQRALNGLLFARCMNARLLAEEFAVVGSALLA
jgi:hypothetical protein